MGLRDRRKAATRGALAQAGMELFFERGFDQVPVEDIAARASVSRRTLFRYFPTKEAVFFHEHAERLAIFRAGVVAERARLGTREAVVLGLLQIGRSYQEDPARAIAFHDALWASAALRSRDLILDAEWERCICALLAAEHGGALAAAIEAGAIMGVVRATLRHWFHVRASFDLTDVGGDALRWIVQGFQR